MSSLLFNIIEKDTQYLNTIPEKIWYSLPKINSTIFIPDNYLIKKIDDTYNFKPDKLALEIYGNDFYYPLLFFPNNIGSILQFHTHLIGTKVKYLDPQYLPKLKFTQF